MSDIAGFLDGRLSVGLGSGMNRLERLYALSERIRRSAPRPVSAATLAIEFEVSRRTIERDLAALRSAGIPLYADRGRTGGQHTLADTGRVIFTLSAAEVSALLIAVAAAGDMPYGDAATAATSRLLDTIAEPTRVQVEQLRARIRTRITDQQQPATRVRRTVEEAVRSTLVLNISYDDANGTSTRRAVEACGFYNGTDGWYLIAWCRLREAGRIFRLDRIKSARLTRETAPYRNLDEILGWIPHQVAAP